MTTEKLYKYFDNPVRSELTSKDFQELITQYPCFSAAHILFLFELKNEESPVFREKLKQHGIHFHNRRHTAAIINGDLFPKLLSRHRKAGSELKAEGATDQTQDGENDLLEFGYQDANDPAPDDSGSFTSWIDRFSDKEEKNELIDKFLQSDVGPIRADAETLLKGDVSKDSIEEDDNFITDTLARIYVKQGMLSKAIFAYEKLSLKFPEKSVYFATQIEEIKRLKKK